MDGPHLRAFVDHDAHFAGVRACANGVKGGASVGEVEPPLLAREQFSGVSNIVPGSPTRTRVRLVV